MLSANNDKAWESAKELMSRHCDGKYRVLAQVQETPAGRGGRAPGDAQRHGRSDRTRRGSRTGSASTTSAREARGR